MIGYARDLNTGSSADAYYQVWRCSEPKPGVYTNAYAEASTDSWPSKSRYLAHNARLYVNGSLKYRSRDVKREVSNASWSNYITSISTVKASYELSCPQALVVTLEARTWHKGISIDDEREEFYKSDTYEGE